MVGLAYMLAEGKSIDPDFELAFNLLKKAAEVSDPDALYNLAVFYLTGKRGNPDYEQAVSYFNQAISLQHTLAAYNLGLIHMYGIGSFKSCSLASNLFKLVAERGSASKILEEAH